jgi:glyceraldehyde 3-phosphate dehydrogenase
LRSFTWLGTARDHGIAQGTVEVDGDFLILSGEKIHTSRCRDPKEVGWGAL